jgi:sulfur-carrier protein
MPVAWIPSLMKKLTDGKSQIEVEGETVRQVIENLDAVFPGFRARLCTEDGRLKPEIAVAIDGEVTVDGLRTPVEKRSEVHFLPALAGG